MRQSLAILAAATAALAARPADEVTSLPGWTGNLPAKWYSGYLDGKVQNAKLHYIYTEASGVDPATAPVTIWLNGGPGCSSLEGLFAEHGQLWVNDAGTGLVANPNTWGNITNTLFIEAPGCVGYSVASKCSWNDNSTAVANANAVGDFFAGFPELLSNDLYIAGESYAGIYVPTLAFEINQRNQGGSSSWTKLPLKGILVGNGCLGNDVGVCGGSDVEVLTNVPFYGGHALLPQTTMKSFQEECLCPSCDPAAPSLACDAIIATAHLQVGDVNIYDIYAPCINSMDGETKAHRGDQARALRRHLQLQGKLKASALTGPDACIDGGALGEYLNTPAVASALHITSGVGSWTVCSENPAFDYTSTQSDESKTIYPVLIASGIRVIIFNGDADACVPYLDNERWTANMNLTQKTAWHQWLDADGQNAGYAIEYDGLTFATVKGAGHMVPEYRPPQAWVLFSRFISGQSL